MNILLLGSGGREHAFASKISQSKHCSKLFIAPGNAGTLEYGVQIDLDVMDIPSLRKYALHHQIDMLIVGPEAPLVAGIKDAFSKGETAHIKVVGPGKNGAMLEGSKAFAKVFMEKYGIPTAAYKEVNAENVEEGIAFLHTMQAPYVLKADGLAGGKGVLIIHDIKEAITELESMLKGKFGTASQTIIIEEFLSGIEFSVFALTDGSKYILLPEAKDYKRIGEGDRGLNTGGMGAVSPVPFVDEVLWDKVIKQIVKPTIHGLESDGLDYKGFVFFGLISVQGNPYVIEYNCRMGDPETEVVIPRIKSDLVELFIALFEGTLEKYNLQISDDSAATIMLVSGGYPEDFEKGKVIYGLDKVENVQVFHAGTTIEDNKVLTNGGRVLAVTALDKNFKVAVNKAVENAEKITFEGKYFRRDIGFDL